MFREKTFLIITILFSIVCCGWFLKLTIAAQKRAAILDESASNRADNARTSKSSDILVGVVYNGNTSSPDHVVNALEQAKKKINDSGMLGARKIKLVIRDDQGKVSVARKIAQSFADDININYVIGHLNSTVAIKVQPIYEFYGILFFSPAASTPRLTRNGAKYFFRNYPNDKRVGAYISNLCRYNGWKRVAIVYPNNVYGKGVESSIESSSDIDNVDVIGRYSFDPNNPEFINSIDELKKYYSFDALVGIFDHEDHGKSFLQAVIDVGLDVPLILSPDLAELDFGDVTKQYNEVIHVMDVKPDLNEPSELTAKFVEEFVADYGEEPRFFAYNSYDALWAIATAIQINGNAAEDVAQYLHSNKSFVGVSGIFSFDDKGDTDKRINIDYYLPQK